jgi:hypothetical protein
MTALPIKLVDSVSSSRVTLNERRRRSGCHVASGVAFLLARVALLFSMFVPYWTMLLQAPQYPDGLRVQAYLNRLEGDVDEIDGLNHYIGMRKLDEAAQPERFLAIPGVIAMVLMLEAVMLIRSRWAFLMAIPVILFPAFFLTDLYLWMSHFGQNLDPKAPLASSIKPFTPPILGTGVIGQFKTIASAGPGLLLAAAASVLVLAGLFLRHRTGNPLTEAAR